MGESTKAEPSGESLQDKLRRERPAEQEDPVALLAALKGISIGVTPKPKPEKPWQEESERPLRS